MTVTQVPGCQQGRRTFLSTIEQRARDEPDSPWVSLPVDEDDLTKRFRDMSYREFNNAVNRTVHWLKNNLPESSEPFQCFAYAGPRDLRYPLLTVAAGKLRKVIILPSPLVTAESQLRILEKKQCTIYMRTSDMAKTVDSIAQVAPDVTTIEALNLDDLFDDKVVKPYVYSGSWDEAKDDPWIVFHTSGTTGHPKPITYTHRMMAAHDVAAKPRDVETHLDHYSHRRWYTPLPSLHCPSMLMILSWNAFAHMTSVLPPNRPQTPELVADVLHYGRVQGALVNPALVDDIILRPIGLAALRTLDYIHYIGAPLCTKTGEKLASHVNLVPLIGSTEAGGYPTKVRIANSDWDYVAFQENAGVQFEPRMDNLHELVFTRQAGSNQQQIFYVRPELDRYETKDLWQEHPVLKGHWKLIGRSDDYVCLGHGEGIYAARLEAGIQQHESIKSALIGGSGQIAPVVILELMEGVELDSEGKHHALMESLRPYFDELNVHCHGCVKLSVERTIFAAKDKPFVRTIKGTVVRLLTLKLYEDEVSALFEER